MLVVSCVRGYQVPVNKKDNGHGGFQIYRITTYILGTAIVSTHNEESQYCTCLNRHSHQNLVQSERVS